MSRTPPKKRLPKDINQLDEDNTYQDDDAWNASKILNSSSLFPFPLPSPSSRSVAPLLEVPIKSPEEFLKPEGLRCTPRVLLPHQGKRPFRVHVLVFHEVCGHNGRTPRQPLHTVDQQFCITFTEEPFLRSTSRPRSLVTNQWRLCQNVARGTSATISSK